MKDTRRSTRRSQLFNGTHIEFPQLPPSVYVDEHCCQRLVKAFEVVMFCLSSLLLRRVACLPDGSFNVRARLFPAIYRSDGY